MNRVIFAKQKNKLTPAVLTEMRVCKAEKASQRNQDLKWESKDENGF